MFYICDIVVVKLEFYVDFHAVIYEQTTIQRIR